MRPLVLFNIDHIASEKLDSENDMIQGKLTTVFPKHLKKEFLSKEAVLCAHKYKQTCLNGCRLEAAGWLRRPLCLFFLLGGYLLNSLIIQHHGLA